jgi:holo-[acyl-carrier protein] synthase
MIIGIGIDLVRVRRIRAAAERWRERFLNRVFTPSERAYAFDCARPYPRLAARFAAKEAVFKALATGWSDGVRWTDVEVAHTATGAPTVQVHGRLQRLLRQRGVSEIRLSLSHDGDYSLAQVILVRAR